MIESIEKLRTSAWNMAKGSNLVDHEECNLLLIIADEIEREIESRYMELPVDADGVPIHVHDWIEVDDKKQRVAAVAIGSAFWWEEDGCHWKQSFMCRYVKPRTLEDVLTDFANEVVHQSLHQSHKIGLTSHELTMRYADEIRELIEVDE